MFYLFRHIFLFWVNCRVLFECYSLTLKPLSTDDNKLGAQELIFRTFLKRNKAALQDLDEFRHTFFTTSDIRLVECRAGEDRVQFIKRQKPFKVKIVEI